MGGVGRKRRGLSWQLLVSKLDMMRHLLSSGLSKAKIRRLYNFITTYVSFQNSENKLKFEQEVRKITKSREAMGLEEVISNTNPCLAAEVISHQPQPRPWRKASGLQVHSQTGLFPAHRAGAAFCHSV